MMHLSKRGGVVLVLALGLWMLAIAALMLRARSWALDELATPQARTQWQAWRQAVAEDNQAESAAVRRRVPQSTEPPALVLLRDYFAVILGGALFFGTLLFLVTVALFRGALRKASPSPDHD